MLSTSISGVVFALLILILQTLTEVSALPTSTTTTTTNTGAQLETREASDSSPNSTVPPNNTATSNKVTPAQIAGVVIGALCTLALALIFGYCFVQHRRRKQELREMQEKAAAIENMRRADPNYKYARSIDARS